MINKRFIFFFKNNIQFFIISDYIFLTDVIFLHQIHNAPKLNSDQKNYI